MSQTYAEGNVPMQGDAQRPLLVKQLNVLNAIAGGGGGGGGGGSANDYIAYAGPPVINPPAIANIVVDVNGRQFQFYNGAWH